MKLSKTYTSHDIQNEIIAIAANMIQESLGERIRTAGHFGVIADETTDLSTSEQVSVCVRIVEELEPVEIFMGFYETTSTTGQVISAIILDVFKKTSDRHHEVPLADLRRRL